MTYTSPQWSLSPGGVKVRISTPPPACRSMADSAGNPLKVYYTDPAGTVYEDDVRPEVPQPHTVLEIERIESGSPLGNGGSVRRQRQLRHLPGRRRPDLDVPNHLRRVARQSSQYRVGYVFEYDPNTWKEIYAFRDKVTRRTPADVMPSTGNDHGIYTYTPPQQAFGAWGCRGCDGCRVRICGPSTLATVFVCLTDVHL